MTKRRVQAATRVGRPIPMDAPEPRIRRAGRARVGIKVSAEKTARPLAVGYDKDGWDAEAFGVRAKKRKGQRESVGHRT